MFRLLFCLFGLKRSSALFFPHCACSICSCQLSSATAFAKKFKRKSSLQSSAELRRPAEAQQRLRAQFKKGSGNSQRQTLKQRQPQPQPGTTTTTQHTSFHCAPLPLLFPFLPSSLLPCASVSTRFQRSLTESGGEQWSQSAEPNEQ